MLSRLNNFFTNPWDTPPESIRREEEFYNVSLELCENGKEIAGLLVIACSDEMSTTDFYNWISYVSFDQDKKINDSTQLYILFSVIKSGNVAKLEAIRSLPSYDQIPLNLRDSATGQTTISISGSFLMSACVQQIIRKQRLERDGGAELLAKNGYHQYASGLSIIPSLKDGSQERKMAENAMRQEEAVHSEIRKMQNL